MPKACHTLLRDEPRRRPNNIRIPVATHLQPPDRLGKRKGHDALAKSMGREEKYLHRPCRTNPKRIPTTLQSIRRKRGRQIPPKMRRGPCDQPERRRPSSPRLQNLPTIARPRLRTNQVPRGTPPQ